MLSIQSEFPFIPHMVALSVLKASPVAKPWVKGWEGSIFIFIIIEYYNRYPEKDVGRHGEDVG